MSKEISRRDFLRVAGLWGASAFISGCCGISRLVQPKEISPKPEEVSPKPPLKIPTETEKLPKPTIEPTPTPIGEGKGDSPADILKSLKEKEQGILWTHELLVPPERPSARLPEAFFTNQDKIFLATPEGYPAAFNLTKGEKLWQWEDRGMVYGAEPETVYVVRPDKRLYALDTQTGQTKWKTVFGVDESTNVDWPMWIGKETLHFPFWMTSFGMLRTGFASIDKRTGNILWWVNDRGNIRGSEVVALTEKILLAFFSYGDEPLVGLDPLTGGEKWVSSRGGSYFSENSFLSLYEGERLTAFDINSNTQLWQSERTNIREITALSANRVYTLDSESNLVVLDRQTGKELWSWPDVSYEGFSFVGEIERLAIIEHKNLGYTYGVEASTGTSLWKNDDLILTRLVGISKDTLIGVCQPSFLFGLNLATGERKWRLELSQVTHKVILFGDKLIYGSGQTLAVLNPETGALISTIPLPDRPTRLAPQKDFLFAQTGTPGGLGTLSAVQF